MKYEPGPWMDWMMRQKKNKGEKINKEPIDINKAVSRLDASHYQPAKGVLKFEEKEE